MPKNFPCRFKLCNNLISAYEEHLVDYLRLYVEYTVPNDAETMKMLGMCLGVPRSPLFDSTKLIQHYYATTYSICYAKLRQYSVPDPVRLSLNAFV